MPLDVEDLMTRYARRGIANWGDAPNHVKQRAMAALSNNIATHVHEVQQTIKTLNAAGRKFIPMPRINHDGILFCFFLPMRVVNGENVRFAFDLFLLIDDEHCLGFRFEPADPPDHSHAYGHVQMNRGMLGGNLPVNGIPEWVPDSYPAFPICSSDPLQMFLSMATSLHGYGSGYVGGMQDILREAFQNQPLDVGRYLEKMNDFLK
jgi:hypothetical protein